MAKVTIEGRVLKGVKSNGDPKFTTYSPSDPWLVSDLLKAGGHHRSQAGGRAVTADEYFRILVPDAVADRRMDISLCARCKGGGRGGAFSFGKSRARMLDESTNPVTFGDVACCEEAKEEVSELVISCAIRANSRNSVGASRAAC